MLDNIYSWDEIKAAGDCQRYMTEVLRAEPQGREGEWQSFNSPFRAGSDSKAFRVSKLGYKDMVTGDTGSILDLCANARYGGNLFEAANELGEWLRLEPKQRLSKTFRIVKVYDYRDLAGNIIHQTVRRESDDGEKRIEQRRPDPADPTKYINGLTGIVPILYRLPEWAALPTVYVVEGEKCADACWYNGIAATTNPMGAGKWEDRYSESLRGKNVIVLPDNDDVGEAHAVYVAVSLKGIAASVKIVPLPGLAAKEDVYEWFNLYGKSAADLRAIADAAPLVDYDTLTAERLPEQTELAVAKKANESPLSNYTYSMGTDDQGKPVRKMVPLPILSIYADMMRRFLNFPRVVGSTLFDHDRKTGEIRLFKEASEFVAWVSEKSGRQPRWSRKLEGAATWEQMMATVKANSQKYDGISGVPTWPTRGNIYYTHGQLPDPTPDMKYLDEFASFFEFPSDEDRDLFKVLCASAIYYKPKVDRPIWIIDSTDAQGCGKTKLSEFVAALIGGKDPEVCEPIWIDPQMVNNEQTMLQIIRRLLSPGGRLKRILVIDNVVGYFKSPAIATLATQGSISGMAPYGHGEETRVNDLTIILTSNSASVDTDFTSRCFIIHVKMPTNPRPRWATEVRAYIDRYRLNIIADIVGRLNRGPSVEIMPVTRYKEWEVDVMASILPPAGHSRAWKTNEQRKVSANGEIEEAEIVESFFTEKITEFYPAKNGEVNVWLSNRVVSRWANEAITGFGGRDGRNATQRIRNMVKSKMLSRFDIDRQKWKHVRGILYLGDPIEDEISGMCELNADGGIRLVNCRNTD